MTGRAVFVDFSRIMEDPNLRQTRIPGALRDLEATWGLVIAVRPVPRDIESQDEAELLSSMRDILKSCGLKNFRAMVLRAGAEVPSFYRVQAKYNLFLYHCLVIHDPANPLPGTEEIDIRCLGPVERLF